MYKYLIVVLALVAVAAAQFYYGGAVSGPSFHGPFASSASTGIRRGLPTGYLSTTYYAQAPVAPLAYYY